MGSELNTPWKKVRTFFTNLLQKPFSSLCSPGLSRGRAPQCLNLDSRPSVGNKLTTVNSFQIFWKLFHVPNLKKSVYEPMNVLCFIRVELVPHDNIIRVKQNSTNNLTRFSSPVFAAPSDDVLCFALCFANKNRLFERCWLVVEKIQPISRRGMKG